MHSEVKAKVFQNGRSQAVRIPAQYRFSTDQVYLEHDPEKGTITLSERPLQSARGSMADLFARINAAGGFEFELDRDLRPAEERGEL